MHIREVVLYESYILDAYDVHVINKQIEELQTMIKSTADNVNYFNQSIGYSNNLDDIRANVLILINSTIDSLMITQSDIINQHLMKWQRENTLVEQSKQLDELLNSSIYKYFVNWQCEPYCHCNSRCLIEFKIGLRHWQTFYRKQSDSWKIFANAQFRILNSLDSTQLTLKSKVNCSIYLSRALWW